MQMRNEKILCLLLFAVMVGFAVWGHFNLPDVPVAVHFGADGQPNGYQSRDMAMVLMPALTGQAAGKREGEWLRPTSSVWCRWTCCAG